VSRVVAWTNLTLDGVTQTPARPDVARMSAATTVLRRAAWCLVFLIAACRGESEADDTQYRNIIPFDTAEVRLASTTDTTILVVELASSNEQQTLGLMERRTLAENAGMLFLYPTVQPESSAFWMFRTRIPLDIAFVDDSGVIRSIRAMEPCTSDLAQACQSYPAGASYRAALEVNRGYFDRKRIRLGDRVVLDDTLRRRRASTVR
jgi:uncharacterized protein